MKKQENRSLLAGLVLLCLFALWTIVIMCVDVLEIGPQGTSVGLAALNGWFHRLTGVHMPLYVLTDWLGIVPVGVCMLFAATGFAQLIRRRRFAQVDRDLLLLGGYYAVVVIAYLAFEAFPVNYRPVLIDGRLEASYPSSTTLLSISVMSTLIERVRRRVECTPAKNAICLLAVTFSGMMVLCRLLSGVHWLTDIVGGLLLGQGLYMVYKATVARCCR